MLLGLYNCLLNLAFCFFKGKLQKKYTNGFAERQGKFDTDKISHLVGKCFWINAVSVGEAQAAVSFIKAARNEGISCPFLLSTTTETGRKMAFDLAGTENLFTHTYAVWDKKDFVINALETIKPIAYATVETEIWPNMLLECRKRKIKTILINGRISDRTWHKISRPFASHIAGRVFSLFDVITCRDETDRRRLTSISVPADKIYVTGDSKIDELLRRKEERQKGIEVTRKKLLSYFSQGTKNLIIAGSTHSPEEEIVFGVFAKLKKNNNDIKVKFISVPRHPERVDTVLEIAEQNGLSAIRLSEIEKANCASNNLDVVVVDKIGVLFDFYGACDIAFVGGSFVNKGGQNILEPLVWGVPTCYGPHMEDFAEPASFFEKEQVAHRVLDAHELYTRLEKLLKNEDKAKNILASDRYFTEHGGTSYKLARIIKPFLEV